MKKVVIRFYLGLNILVLIVVGYLCRAVLPRAKSFRDKVETLNKHLEKSISSNAQWINLYPVFLDAQDGSIRDELSNDELHLLGKILLSL
ncbi:MAG: hypothetical protein JKY66_09705 [Spongiibacteraceae bacterium]|nr:hypothetical protein [Spongiibacteraceae bacterium]